MKVCGMCGAKKEKDQFYFRNKAFRKLHNQCKECYKLKRSNHYDAHYLKYGAAYRKRAVHRSAIVRSRLQREMVSYLRERSCVLCGESDIRTFEFDHLDPSLKSFNVSQGMRMGMSWSKILAEISKCRILCANCHKKHTAEQFGWYKNTS